MRTRWLKPEFFRDKKMGALGPVTALVYQALWIVADDGGTALCNPEQLAGEMFCYWPDVGLRQIDEALRQLVHADRIERYAVGDEHYCHIVNWEKHQRIHNPSAFRHPAGGQPLSVDTDSGLQQDGGSPESALPPPSPPRHLDTSTPKTPKQQTTALVLVSEKKAIPESKLATAIAEWLPMELAWDKMVDGAMRVVFSYWVAKTRRDAARTWLTPERKAHLNSRLRESPKGDIAAATSPLLWAVDGVMSSEFHVQGGHTKLGQIFRSRERLEGFAEMTGGYERGELHPLVNGG